MLSCCCCCCVLCVQDDFYLRHLIKNNLLDPVMDAFFANGDRYNLLNSAVLEMVEFIRKENLKVGQTSDKQSAIGCYMRKFGRWGANRRLIGLNMNSIPQLNNPGL